MFNYDAEGEMKSLKGERFIANGTCVAPFA